MVQQADNNSKLHQTYTDEQTLTTLYNKTKLQYQITCRRANEPGPQDFMKYL